MVDVSKIRVGDMVTNIGFSVHYVTKDGIKMSNLRMTYSGALERVQQLRKGLDDGILYNLHIKNSKGEMIYHAPRFAAAFL